MDSINIGNHSYICTWMFTESIIIWLPSISLAQPCHGILQGHTGIVENCCFHKKKKILISIDSKKNFRVWNFQTV